MINGKGRLQRINRAVRPPGNARDDWEILRICSRQSAEATLFSSIEDVFRRMSETVPQFAGSDVEQNRRSRHAHPANGRASADSTQATTKKSKNHCDPGKTPCR